MRQTGVQTSNGTFALQDVTKRRYAKISACLFCCARASICCGRIPPNGLHPAVFLDQRNTARQLFCEGVSAPYSRSEPHRAGSRDRGLRIGFLSTGDRRATQACLQFRPSDAGEFETWPVAPFLQPAPVAARPRDSTGVEIPPVRKLSTSFPESLL